MADDQHSAAQLEQRIRELEQALQNRNQTLEILRQERQHLQMFADLAHDWEYWRRPDGSLHFVSPSCETVTGYTPEEFMKRPDLLLDIVHPDDHTTVATHLQLQRGPAADFDFRIITQDEQLCWVNHVCQPMYDARGKYIGRKASNRDISKRKAAEEFSTRQQSYLEALHDTALGVIDRLDLDSLLDAMVAKASQLVDATDGFIYLINSEGGVLEMVCSYGEYSRQFRGLKLKPGEGLSGNVFLSGEPQLVRDYRNWSERSDNSGFDELHSALAVPIIIGSEVIGVIGLGNFSSERYFGNEELNIMHRFAEVAAIAVDNARLHAKVQKSEREFYRLFERAPYGIFVANSQQIVIDANPKAHDILEYPIGALIGMAARDLVHPADLNQTPLITQEQIQAAGEIVHLERRYRTAKGQYKPVELSFKPLDRGRTHLAMFRDISARKKAEIILQEKEKRYRTLFEKAGDAIFIIKASGMHAGRILDANQAAAVMHGYAIKDIKQMNIRDLDAPDDAARVQDRIRRMLDGEWLQDEIWHRRQDGTLFPVEVSAGMVELEGQQVILAFDRDISERKEAADAIYEQIHFLHTLIDTIPSPIFFKNAEGHYLGCNKAFEGVIGLSKDAVVGKTVFEIAPHKLAKRYEEADRILIESGGIQRYEAAVRYADGSIHDVLFNKAVYYKRNGTPGGLVGVMTDMTEYRMIEEQRLLLSTALEQSPEIIFITDTNGIIQYINSSFERISGYTRNEVIGQSPQILKSGRHDDAFYQGIWDTIKEGGVWTGHIINRRKDGSFFDVEAVISPVKTAAQKSTHFVAVERDISDEKRKEKQLRQAQKMEAIGTLAGGIAHDFNNLLSAIIGYTEICLQDNPENVSLADHLTHVLDAGSRARDLVQQILTFSRQNDVAQKPVKVATIVKEALGLIRSSFPSTIAIDLQVDSKATVLADPTQIHQIVMNLCTNAHYVMRDTGGQLTVRMADVNLTDETTAGQDGLAAGRYVHLAVCDSGPGIPESIIDNIFDPFFTTKEEGEGTGLGLSVVHGIVEGCGGTIFARNRSRGGAVVELYIPAIDRKAGEDNHQSTLLPKGSEKIMVVDDEAYQVDVAQQMLERLGYQVIPFTDSMEALESFRQAPQAIDLVFTDTTMPQMTGDILGQAMLAIRPDLPIIICTGYTERINQSKALKAGFRDLLMKPFIFKELAQTIRKVLDSGTT